MKLQGTVLWLMMAAVVLDARVIPADRISASDYVPEWMREPRTAPKGHVAGPIEKGFENAIDGFENLNITQTLSKTIDDLKAKVRDLWERYNRTAALIKEAFDKEFNTANTTPMPTPSYNFPDYYNPYYWNSTKIDHEYATPEFNRPGTTPMPSPSYNFPDYYNPYYWNSTKIDHEYATPEFNRPSTTPMPTPSYNYPDYYNPYKWDWERLENGTRRGFEYETTTTPKPWYWYLD